MNLTDVIAELRRLNEPVPESLSLPTYKDVEAAESDGIGQRLAERQPSSRKNSAACHHASVDAHRKICKTPVCTPQEIAYGRNKIRNYAGHARSDER